VVSFTPWPLYPQGKSPHTHWIGGWVGPRAVVDAVVKRKIPSPGASSIYIYINNFLTFISTSNRSGYGGDAIDHVTFFRILHFALSSASYTKQETINVSFGTCRYVDIATQNSTRHQIPSCCTVLRAVDMLDENSISHQNYIMNCALVTCASQFLTAMLLILLTTEG